MCPNSTWEAPGASPSATRRIALRPPCSRSCPEIPGSSGPTPSRLSAPTAPGIATRATSSEPARLRPFARCQTLRESEPLRCSEGPDIASARPAKNAYMGPRAASYSAAEPRPRPRPVTRAIAEATTDSMRGTVSGRSR